MSAPVTSSTVDVLGDMYLPAEDRPVRVVPSDLRAQCDSGAALMPIREPETMPAPVAIGGGRDHLRLVTALCECFPGVSLGAIGAAFRERPHFVAAFVECDLETCRRELQHAGFVDHGPMPEAVWP